MLLVYLAGNLFNTSKHLKDYCQQLLVLSGVILKIHLFVFALKNIIKYCSAHNLLCFTEKIDLSIQN